MNPGRRNSVGKTRKASAEAPAASSGMGPGRLIFLSLLCFGLLAALAFAWINRGDLSGQLEKLLTKDWLENPVVHELPNAAPEDNIPESGAEYQLQLEEVNGSAPEALAIEMRFALEFEAGSADLAEEGARLLDEAVRSMNSLSGSSAYVIGYTDGMGGDESLPFRRAVRVASYLMTRGIERGRLQVSAAGGDEGAESGGRATVSRAAESGGGVVEVEIRHTGSSG